MTWLICLPRSVLKWLFSSASDAQDCSFRPSVEALEDRAVPADFTRIGPANGAWDNIAHWQGPVNQVPDDESDAAYFTNGSTNNVEVKNANVAIGKLVVTNYYGDIKLFKTLEIKKGDNYPGDSSITSSARIMPQNATANFEVNGATLLVEAGSLGEVRR